MQAQSTCSHTSSSPTASPARRSTSPAHSTPPTEHGESSSTTKLAAKVAFTRPRPPRHSKSATVTPSKISARDEITSGLTSSTKLASTEFDAAMASFDPVNGSRYDPEVDAIFEQTDSENEHQSIPDYHFEGPRNHSMLSSHDSDEENTPPQFGTNGGQMFPSYVSESSPCPSPTTFNSARAARKPLHLAEKTLKDYVSDSTIASPEKRQSSTRSRRSSPARRNKKPVVQVAPSPEPSPLVLLHVTLLPLPVQGAASSVLVSHLRKMISPTVVARGLLLPHPQDDYDGLLEMIAENLGLDEETPPPFQKAETYLEEDEQSHSDASYLSEDDFQELESFHSHCPVCMRRRLKPDYLRGAYPKTKAQRRRSKPGEKWYTVNIFASNGLMKAGAWGRSWEEMERVDVEVKVTPGFEVITHSASNSLGGHSRKSSQRGSRAGSLRSKKSPYMEDLDSLSSSGEDATQRKSSSFSRRRKSSAARSTGSKKSIYVKQEALSEADIPFPDPSRAASIYGSRDGSVPIHGATNPYVDIYGEKERGPSEQQTRMRSEDAWETEDEATKPMQPQAAHYSSASSASPQPKRPSSKRVSDGTTIHHGALSREPSSAFDKDDSPDSGAEPTQAMGAPSSRDGPAAMSTGFTHPTSRPVSGVHRLHPSSRRSSREIHPNEYANSRPTSSHIPNTSLTLVGVAISDDGNAAEEMLYSSSSSESESEPEARSEDRRQTSNTYPQEESDPEEYRRPDAPEPRRDATPAPAPPSPMMSGRDSPVSDVSPIASRNVSRTRGARHSSGYKRHSFTRVSTSPTPQSRFARDRQTSNSSARPRRDLYSDDEKDSSEDEQQERGRSRSSSGSEDARSSSAGPRTNSDKSAVVPSDPLSKFLNDFKDLLRPTVDSISKTPLPTLLLIAVPIVSLLAFSVNSYVAQRNMDLALKQFQLTSTQAQVPNQANYPTQSKEERDEHAYWKSSRPGLRGTGAGGKPVIYGVEVGGRCVMPDDVAEAINSVRHELVPESVVSSSLPVFTPAIVAQELEDEERPFTPKQEDIQNRPVSPGRDRDGRLQSPKYQEQQAYVDEYYEQRHREQQYKRPQSPVDQQRPATPPEQQYPRPQSPIDQSRPITPPEQQYKRPQSPVDQQRPVTPPEQQYKRPQIPADQQRPVTPPEQQQQRLRTPPQQQERPKTPPSQQQQRPVPPLKESAQKEEEQNEPSPSYDYDYNYDDYDYKLDDGDFDFEGFKGSLKKKWGGQGL